MEALPLSDSKPRKARTAFTLLCALMFAAWYVRVYLSERIFPWYSYCITGALLALFIALGARFVPIWFDAWRGQQTPALPIKARRKDLLRVVCMVLLTHAAYLAVVLIRLRLTDWWPESFDQAFHFLDASDSKHYLDIAQNWYSNSAEHDRVVRLVFLPLYPLLIKLCALVTGEYYYTAALLSVLCSAGAGLVLYRMALMDHPRKQALWAVRFYCLFPGFFFYGCQLSEALFMLLALLCVLCARQRRCLLSGVFGALAAFSRSPGLTLLAPVLFLIVQDSAARPAGQKLRYFLCKSWTALLIPLGFYAYLYINYRVSGDWLRFLQYQKNNWFQSPGPFFDTVRYQLDYLLSYVRDGSVANAVGLWGANLFAQFAALALMLLTVKKQNAAYTAFFIVYFVFITGVTWLLSAPRYMLVCFPLIFALTQLSRKRFARALLTACCALLSLLFFLSYLSYNIAVY